MNGDPHNGHANGAANGAANGDVNGLGFYSKFSLIRKIYSQQIFLIIFLFF